jgi:hypothetical protein
MFFQKTTLIKNMYGSRPSFLTKRHCIAKNEDLARSYGFVFVNLFVTLIEFNSHRHPARAAVFIGS